MVASPQLQQALEAAACLCGERDERIKVTGNDDDQARLAIRLEKRLLAYKVKSGTAKEHNYASLEEKTGSCAVDALLTLHNAALEEEKRKKSMSSSSSGSTPVLGARDLQTIHVLLSVVMQWKFLVLISSFDKLVFTLQTQHEQKKLLELPSEEVIAKRRQLEISQFTVICSDIHSTIDQIKPLLGQNGPRSEVTNAFMHSCMPQFVALLMRVGYGPLMSRDDIRGKARNGSAMTFLQTVLRSLSTTSALFVLSTAGLISSSSSNRREGRSPLPIPSFVKNAIERLYSAQLLRADGVMALFRVVIGNEEDLEGSDLIKKLASIGHLLSTPPQGMPIGSFINVIVPRLLEVVSDIPGSDMIGRISMQSTSTQKTASCYALARLQEVAPSEASEILRSIIWEHLDPNQQEQDPPKVSHGQVDSAVVMLYKLAEFSEPSISFLSFLISPVWINLFTLYSFLKGKEKMVKSIKDLSDGTDVKTTAESLLKIYLRIASAEEILKLISPAKKGSIFYTSEASVRALEPDDNDDDEELHAFWDVTEEGIHVIWKIRDNKSDFSAVLSSLGVNVRSPVLSAQGDTDLISAMLAKLRVGPSPTFLTSLLKETSRKDVVVQLLSDLLDSYVFNKQKESVSKHISTSSSPFIYVQHIMELINAFGEDVLLDQIDKILHFIDFSLGDSKGSEPLPSPKVRLASRMDGLLNINIAEMGNSKKEDAEEVVDVELLQTALNLLLALLEGNKDVSMDSHSTLKTIAAKLDSLAKNTDDSEIQHLAREAKMVLIARQSLKISTLEKTSKSTNLQLAYAKGNEMYQEAMKLLQDPILPVRAHGLVLLKDLASHGSVNVEKGILMEPTLTSTIVDIFMQAIEDDDSFLYLNAVKGLAEVANTGGREIIRRLVNLYLNSNERSFSKAHVDKQLRLGEALLQVVQKLEEALSAYFEDIVGPLLTAVRDDKRPTTLRASYLSVLGTCIEASPSAFASSGLSDAIVDTMLDLLSIETTSIKSQSEKEDMQNPTHLDSKLPQLRRAAVLLLALLIRGAIHQLELASEKREKEESVRDGLESLRMPNGRIIGQDLKFSEEKYTSMPLLFNQEKSRRTAAVLNYLAQVDSDSLVRHQCNEVVQELDVLNLALISQMTR